MARKRKYPLIDSTENHITSSGDFVTNVSHEVQSPITSISGYAIALKQEDIADHERSRYLDIIIAEAERMSKLSDSLLKLSLLESQSRQLRLVKFSLDEQIRRVIVALQPQWSARNIRFELNLRAVLLSADHDLLRDVRIHVKLGRYAAVDLIEMVKLVECAERLLLDAGGDAVFDIPF